MTLDNIISRLERYGYITSKSYQTDLAWGFRQDLYKVPDDERTRKEELVLNFKWIHRHQRYGSPLDFNLYEDESVSSDGKLYYTPGKMHYYFSFGVNMDIKISRVYRDDELDLLMHDVHTKLSSLMGVDELRNIKLIDIGI